MDLLQLYGFAAVVRLCRECDHQAQSREVVTDSHLCLGGNDNLSCLYLNELEVLDNLSLSACGICWTMTSQVKGFLGWFECEVEIM